jgi:glutaredoxin
MDTGAVGKSGTQNTFFFGLIGVLVAVIVFSGGYYLCSSQKTAPEDAPATTGQEPGGISEEVPEGVVFYYGTECPHCHDVIEFLEENDIASKVPFERKETWNDKENGVELVERAKICGYAPNQIGVPFLYADGDCFVGTPDVIGYFSERVGLSISEDESSEGE